MKLRIVNIDNYVHLWEFNQLAEFNISLLEENISLHLKIQKLEKLCWN